MSCGAFLSRGYEVPPLDLGGGNRCAGPRHCATPRHIPGGAAEFSPPYAEIQTEALGLSAEEVEQLITVPLEQDLLNGVEGVDVIRSESLPGLSSIVMVFEPGTDIYRGRQLIEERLAQAHALPNVSNHPRCCSRCRRPTGWS